MVHDWHAHGVLPMPAEANARHGGSAEPQQVAGRLHTRAPAGERISKAEWNAARVPALRYGCRLACAYADTFSKAYAELNTTASARTFADANALAVAGHDVGDTVQSR
ncbi:hypothetical protein [Streptomyces sp. NPDC058683]|uniref:hypothetical protein n=1 Tax=Streptomyces sp. NPDC058683 TaxID=3346597 RepID=UPI00364A6E6D